MAAAQIHILRRKPDADRLWTYLRDWPEAANSGNPMRVTVARAGAAPTLGQIKALHAVLGEIAEGKWVEGRRYSLEVWKEYVRRRFIGSVEVELPDGTIGERGISTMKLDQNEYGELIDRVQAWAIVDLDIELS